MLPKPSTTLLAGLDILVVGATRASASLTAGMLRGAGARMVSILTDSTAVVPALRHHAFSAIVIDSPTAPADALALTQDIRGAQDGAPRDIPIVFVCAAADRTRVETARDAGATEFVRRPLSAKVLALRIEQAIARPRPFVEAPAFAGPDRRRRHAAGVPDRRRTLAPPSEGEP